MGKPGRVFVRGVTSERYDLTELRAGQLAAPRVRGDDVVVDAGLVGHSADSGHSRTWWRIGPGDDPFLTQSLQVHFVQIEPGHANKGHGHQNEAVFYVLRGRGHEVHDDETYPWEAGDVVLVHSDSVHQHFNDGDEDALCLVVKAKSTWVHYGLVQQGSREPFGDDPAFGPRQDWSQLWSAGVGARRKVLKPERTAWRLTPDGHVRTRLSAGTSDARCFSVDLYEQRIPVGSRSGRHWHMSDEVLYVLAGSGHSLQWEVRAEIAERYYARVAKEPSRWEFTAGDTIYVPQNTVHQFVNDGDGELMLLSAQNRLVKFLGYDAVVHLEDAPEYAASAGATAVSA